MASLEDDVQVPVALPSGLAHVSAAFARPPGAQGIVAVAHGAGAGFRHPFFDGFVASLNGEGFATVRFNFPYLENGRRMPGPAAHAVATWAAIEAFARNRAPELELWASGKSYGGRMASMAAEHVLAPSGLIYLGYPLHPPGRPDKARTAHLPAIREPQLFVTGTNDPFVDPHDQFEEAVASCQDAETVWVEGGGHSFEVKGRKRTAAEIGAEIGTIVTSWIRTRSHRPAA